MTIFTLFFAVLVGKVEFAGFPPKQKYTAWTVSMVFFSGGVNRFKLQWQYYHSLLQGRSGLCRQTDFVKFICVSIIGYISSEI